MLRNHKFLVRKATKEDVVDLWQWRNDFQTRANSFSRRKISFEKHWMWFFESLKNPCRKIYVVLKREEKIGMVRLDFPNKEVVEVSININPNHRGQGWGTKILKMISNSPKSKRAHQIFKAVVKTNNSASEKVFFTAGFTKVHEVKQQGYSVWVKS